jgi:uncharacterized membrane protein YkgB
MKAEEAAELMDQDKTGDRFKKRAAITIAVLAMLLAITGLGGQNATKEAINENILASNLYNFFQAKNMRQTSMILAANEIELAWTVNPALPDETKAALKKKLDEYRKTIDRYDSEPDTKEGKKELLARAREHQAKRDRALQQDPYFDYAEALLQIAIVLISVAIVADQVWLSFIGGGLGLIGALLTLNGFLLLVTIPGLG